MMNQKLIPRDISESLGKLPPSAIELEESILGAVMLEKSAMDQVAPYLKANHFYQERHVEIFNACLALRSESSPIDMKTVVHKLRETGKIELVGGAYYIAELTSKVSSAANVDYHARVVVEMAMKREMIQIASKIHHDAYEDGTDPFELMDKLEQAFLFFKKNTVQESNENKIKSFWEKALVRSKPPEELPVIYLDSIPVCTLGNHSLLVGKKKSRKTLFITLLIAEYLKKNPDNAHRIMLFDTEQGRSDVWIMREKIYQISGLWIDIFNMRGMSPSERREMIAGSIQYWPSPPIIAVIDGIRDLMSNINDPDESTDLVVWLERLTLTFNMHIINILHLNKTDNNARGHIGSELLNKAEVTIEMELDEKNGCTIVKCESSRRRPFDTFAFTHDKDGLPVVVGTPILGTIVAPSERKKRLEAVFQDGPLKYAEVIEEIKSQFGVGISRAGTMLAAFQREGMIIRNGKARSKDTVYKLMMSSSNGHHEPQPVQATLNLDTKPAEDTDQLPF